jgi:hypothetical protein
MNSAKLMEAQERFFMRYPGGFSNPLMMEIAKKHKIEKMNKLAQESFAVGQFESPDKIIDSILHKKPRNSYKVIAILSHNGII